MARALTSCFALVVAGTVVSSTSSAQQAAPLTPTVLQELHFREIGPAVTGGRIHDVEALPGDPSTIYVATASGGLWKTVNNGTTWQSIFDHQPVSTFGDIAIAPSNPDVIWAGTGEQNNRQSSSWGDGVYRSTDAGKTWTHLGLEETRHIGRVVVHPANPDIAYVAALGDLWKPSPERGVFKTTDGGQSWNKVLYPDTLTGAVDLVMDPGTPNTLYAATYQRLRKPWGFNGGGPGSGIYRSGDGGATWSRLTNGLPSGDVGRVGLAIAASNPRVVMATIEHRTAGGTYRSEDGGETWRRVNSLNPRPMYYSEIRIDPRDENRVYVLGTQSYTSEDGGATFHELPTAPTYDVGVHADHHALWIDPTNTRHFFLGGDGGLYETWDRGATYDKINNFAIGQFYNIGLDMREPYFVYGGLQDTHSWVGPSATRHWEGILNDDWREIGFGDGMYQQPDPTSHRFVYSNSSGGGFTRVDAETGDILDIVPTPPAGEPDYRWDWDTPTLVSRHDPRTVYLGGNRLFISHDRGVSWDRTIDLSRQINRDTLSLMGVRGSAPMLSKNDGEGSFGEITTIAESPLDSQVLWVGTDDGNVQVSRDAGRTWTEVSRNLTGVASGTYVSRVLASRAGPGVAYATFDAHRDGDFAPYVFRTTDFGRTWAARAAGLPEGSVKAIAEHHGNANLLFLGTEHALWVSNDAGNTWVRFMPNLPTTLYDDIAIHPRDGDLVLGTHGRSIWILDDLTALAEWSPATAGTPHLFSIRPATIFQYWKDTSYRGQGAFAGENPPFGAILSYYLPKAARSVTLTVADASGSVVRRLGGPGVGGVMHRVAWDLRHEPPASLGAAGIEAGNEGEAAGALPVLAQPVGPRGTFVSPGTFTVTLNADGATSTQQVVVKPDPLMPVTEAQYREREAFLVALSGLQQRAVDLAKRAGVRAGGFGPRAAPARGDSLAALRTRIGNVVRNLDRLAADLNGSAVQPGSLYPPTETQKQRRADLERELTAVQEAWDRR